MIPAKSRPAWAEIDPDALVNNARLIRHKIGKSKLCAVVKADGYGHGSMIVAQILENSGVDCFAVANVDEALELRNGGIRSPILCLSEPIREAVESALEQNITLTLYSHDAIEAVGEISRSLSKSGNLPIDNLRYHLKVDSGMHRVGANPQDIVGLAVHGRQEGLELAGFWTHLSVADSKLHEDIEFTKSQLVMFQKLKLELLAQGFRPEFHVANSAAVINYPEAHFDMVRTGIALYGYAPSVSCNIEGLSPVLSLKARVSYVRRVARGTRPSYGRRRATEDDETWLATVPIGYADGVPRSLFEANAEVLIGGKRRQLAGAVTMDQIIVDCGPSNDVNVGDEVVLLGTQDSQVITADDWAVKLNTINYEVITRIGFRVPRTMKSNSGLGEKMDNDKRNAGR